ncbi:MAG: 3-dehydroquinate synthase [Bacteroidia bacterium]
MQAIISSGYKIHTGKIVFRELKQFLKAGNYSQYFIICDENTIKHCLPVVVSACKELKAAEIFEVESGEQSKSLALCSQIWEALITYRADKQALIINLGGGVISDLGGFIASAYKRGVDFINIPTSLLAMADASVGGKTGIDLGGVKNSIGTITQPKAVFVFHDFLKTLDSRQVYNGLAEIYKIALISDKIFWKRLADTSAIKESDGIIDKSIELKNKVVKKDPYEKNIRKSLNFGHSIGHAVESALLHTEAALLHGEAIVVGMIAETYIAYEKKLVSEKDAMQIFQTLKTVFAPQPVSQKHLQAIFTALLNDKKNKKDQFLFSLVNGIGKCKMNVPVKEKEISEALAFYNEFVK